MILKMLRYFSLLLLLLRPTISFSDDDLTHFFEEYTHHSKYVTSNTLAKNVFEKWAKSTMMTRVKNFKKIVEEERTLIRFLADYLPPGTKNFIPAEIIIYLESNPRFDSFHKNIVHAELTGDMMKDKFNPQTERPFSLDNSDGRIQINLSGEDNPNRAGIALFYEMQIETIIIDGMRDYLTTLITEPEVQNMSHQLFEDNTSKEENTTTFLRYMHEMAIGARNINQKKILHGNIRPKNIILVKGDDDLLHPKFIDFDLMLDGRKNEFKSNTLRYTEDFRPPWIHNDFKDIFYNKKFTEDTYALGATIMWIFQKNKKFLDITNGTLITFVLQIKRLIIKRGIENPRYIPTTEQIERLIDAIIKDNDDLFMEMAKELSESEMLKKQRAENRNRELNVEPIKNQTDSKIKQSLIIL